MNRSTYLLFALAICLVSSCNSAHEESEESAPEKKEESTPVRPARLERPIDLLPEATGKFTREISTDNEKVQAYFNQGIQLKYAFAVDEAVRSFREGYKIDSTCTMCYFGEAWALGSYLNSHMSEEKAPFAFEAISKAAELAESNATEVEKDLIQAMQIRYIEDYVYDERRHLDSLFSDAMRKVYEKHPDDLDVATIFAEALFLLEPRRGTRELDDPRVMEIHKVLEGVLDKDIEHPGACHLYLHATESTEKPELGESCADYLGNSIPGASHINHMPSHTWNEVGRWGESVRANIQAIHTDQKAKLGRAVAIYPTHNFHMLLYAASFDGQGAIAMQAGKDFSKATGNAMFHAMTLLRFGRFDEILELKDRPERDIPGGLWDFCQGYAHLKNGDADFAQVYLERVQKAASSSTDSYRFHPARHVLGVVGKILEGEIAWSQGEMSRAINAFEEAVRIEDSMTYDEPEVFPFAARHWLGALVMEQERWAMAERIYRAELDDHPHNGWSLYPLVEALKKQEKDYSAELEDLEQSWARSDTWIESSRF